MKAMILAAGKGTRMLPLTESMPKPLIQIQGVTLLEHTIRYLKYYGVDEIIINVHHFAGQIIDFIRERNSFGIRIEFSDETGELLDTGGGLYKARWFFDDGQPFILTSSDVITTLDIKAMMLHHRKMDSLVTLAVKHRKSSRDFIFDSNFSLCGWHNNNTGETRMVKEADHPVNIAFSAIHVISPAIFDHIIERGRFSIIQLYLRLALQHPIRGFEHDDSMWIECGQHGYLETLNQSSEIQDIYRMYH
jgi:N-acetyl-alpha-D-muramate 1-phosphate uridylyltransferase